MPLKHFVLGLAIAAMLPIGTCNGTGGGWTLRSVVHLSHWSIRGLGNTLR